MNCVQQWAHTLAAQDNPADLWRVNTVQQTASFYCHIWRIILQIIYNNRVEGWCTFSAVGWQRLIRYKMFLKNLLRVNAKNQIKMAGSTQLPKLNFYLLLTIHSAFDTEERLKWFSIYNMLLFSPFDIRIALRKFTFCWAHDIEKLFLFPIQ